MRLHSHIHVHASAATCFDVSQDDALRPLWDSLTPRAHIHAHTGAGTPVVARYVQRQSRQRLRALKRLAESQPLFFGSSRITGEHRLDLEE
ncbi:MAG: hypothetical protein Q4F13_14890, partial [Pseudomonadota bacterium]|nr:hypothetical protein [Pseudomonadota bacterium]